MERRWPAPSFYVRVVFECQDGDAVIVRTVARERGNSSRDGVHLGVVVQGGARDVCGEILCIERFSSSSGIVASLW